MTEIDALRDLNARLQMKMSLNADDAVAEQRRLQARIDWLEGTAMPHARLQSHADGFQTGWHAALTRVQAGDFRGGLASSSAATKHERGCLNDGKTQSSQATGRDN